MYEEGMRALMGSDGGRPKAEVCRLYEQGH